LPHHLDAQKSEEHRVAIQLMRHTLMHTGALRYLYDETAEVAYTRRIHFDDTFPSEFDHYTLTVEDRAHQDDALAAVHKGQVVAVKALNLWLTVFAADVLRVVEAYTAAMSANKVLRVHCESVYPEIRVSAVEVNSWQIQTCSYAP
jgi:hypothetical protein